MMATAKAKSIGFAASIFLLATSSHPGLAALLARGSCSPDTTKYIVSDLQTTTDSQSYIAVPETFISFTQGGTTASCVIVSFSGMAITFNAGNVMRVQPLLDAATPCQPQESIFDVGVGAGNVADRAMNFVCHNVSPGAHTIRMQFRSNSGTGNSVSLWNRTTIIQHKK